MTRARLFSFFAAACIVSGLGVFAYTVHAQSASDIQAQIDAHNAQIAALDAEIAQYQAQVDQLGAQKQTLQSAISSLTAQQKQLGAQISVTQTKISSANLQLQKLALSIGSAQDEIEADTTAIGKAIRDIAESDQAPLIEQLFSADSLGQAWNSADQALQLNAALAGNIEQLKSAKVVLATNVTQVSATKAQLVTLQSQLVTQQQSVAASKAAQQALLTQTNGKESQYQALIAAKKASEQSFEDELNSLQSQLDLIVHPGSLPKVGTGVLSWPFSLAFMQNCASRKSVFGNLFCVTQYFGTTPFSTANPQVYNGSGHNGIDIAAPIGTPVEAALGGVVYGTGNTDLVHDSKGHQCYSFGKWVMVKHSNGINTMYAHLSQINVSLGQPITTGQVLGLSGMTGYATGPHLHFGVYATEGTEIMTLRQFRGATIGCADAEMPVATLDAYLNPLSYL